MVRVKILHCVLVIVSMFMFLMEHVTDKEVFMIGIAVFLSYILNKTIYETKKQENE